MQKIEEAVASNNYNEAFTVYSELLHANPLIRKQHQETYTEVLYNWAMQLESLKKIDVIYDAYKLALRYFPDNIILYVNLGNHLMRLDKFWDAKIYLEYACQLDKKNLQAKYSLEHAKASLVPCWHFRMLNDCDRNLAYYKAIEKHMNENYDKVVDIGAGCGLLSLFASSSINVQKVTAIEESDALCNIAKSIFSLNNISSINIINRPSNQVSVKEVDANLLVTEIFDAALFGEHMLETLMYALNFVISKEKWKVIPLKAIVYIAGISSCDVIKKHRLLQDVLSINLCDICVTQQRTEPYEGENLSSLNVSYMTESTVVGEVDFTDYEGLMKLFLTGEFCPQLTLKSTQDGFIDAFAVWFDLQLDDTITISTSPFNGNVRCWEQAVFYQDHKIIVKKGSQIDLAVNVIDNCLQIKVKNKSNCKKCFKISQDIILLLNDTKYIDKISYLVENMDKNQSGLTIFDLNVFPVFGLLMGIRGAKIRCKANSQADKEFFKHLFALNNITDVDIFGDDTDIKKELIASCDYCFIQPVLRSGILDEQIFTSYLPQHSNLTLLPNIIIPVLQLIECDYIDYYNKVDDRNVCGFKIASVFNSYAVSQHLLFKDNIPYKALTSSVQSANIMNITDLAHEMTIATTNCGLANAVLYWFECGFQNHNVINTSECNYYSRACFILDTPITVCKNNKLVLNIQFSKGLLALQDINCDKMIKCMNLNNCEASKVL